MESEAHILVVTADPMLLADVSDALDESFGAIVHSATSTLDARQQLAATTYDLIISDSALADEDLAALIEKATVDKIPTILVENELVAERVLAALRAGVVDVLTQPLDFGHLE